MAWIESHQELARHPKTKKLARLLGASIPSAIGHLHLLWWWSIDYSKDGYLGSYEPEDLADAVMWEGDPQLLWRSLADAGFLDSSDEPTSVSEDGIRFEWRIHNWDKYGGKLLEKRRNDADRKRSDRLGLPLNGVPATSGGHPTEGTGTQHNSTGHNTTVPDKTYVAATAAASVPEYPLGASLSESKPEPATDQVAVIFGEYRSRVQAAAKFTDDARRKITTRLKTFTADELVSAMAHFSADTWQMENNGHRSAAWFFASDTRVEQYVNLAPKKSPAPKTDSPETERHKTELREAGARAQAAVLAKTVIPAEWEAKYAALGE